MFVGWVVRGLCGGGQVLELVEEGLVEMALAVLEEKDRLMQSFSVAPCLVRCFSFLLEGEVASDFPVGDGVSNEMAVARWRFIDAVIPAGARREGQLMTDW